MELRIKIPKRQLPRSYIQQLGITDPYKWDLGPDWRMTYEKNGSE